MKKIALFLTAFIVFLISSCTKLDEKFSGDLTPAQIGGSGSSSNAATLLRSVYNSMRTTYQDQGQVFALFEQPTDELIAPTRGPDWDDNGVWRVLHLHKWDGDNQRIQDSYNALCGTIYAATDMLQTTYGANAVQQAQARFLRAVSMFDLLDGWNQVVYREPGESTLAPSKVRVGAEALNYIIAEVEAIKDVLPDGPSTVANKWGARVLLMRCYLNKAVISATPDRSGPFTFAAADMTKVVSLADEIINSGKFSFATNYFDNFAPNNNSLGRENIWTFENLGGSESGPIRSRYHMGTHYNQNPGGWNGFSTLSDFYDKFESTDKRRGVAYTAPGGLPNPGNRVNVGFLVGQQYDLTTDAPLKDRTNAPLSFTRAVKSIETGSNLEVTGIRLFKYPVDFPNQGNGNWDNDFVFYRLSDVLLMKAEAQLRSNNATAALTIVNSIRLNRGATALASLTVDNLLDERGRELYLENVRRNDLIRFGKFLLPWQEKPVDDKKYLLFTIPNNQLAGNPNLKQNPGY
jgi:starch-binding outer membrane protein, SusD/RagB family